MKTIDGFVVNRPSAKVRYEYTMFDIGLDLTGNVPELGFLIHSHLMTDATLVSFSSLDEITPIGRVSCFLYDRKVVRITWEPETAVRVSWRNPEYEYTVHENETIASLATIGRELCVRRDIHREFWEENPIILESPLPPLFVGDVPCRYEWSEMANRQHKRNSKRSRQ